MSICEIIKIRSCDDEETRMELLLAIHCAPILTGSKAANIVTVTLKEFHRIEYLLQGTGISYRFLKTKRDQGILYLYREEQLIRYLRCQEVSSFLREYGYREKNLNSMLYRLSNRISLYNCGVANFPHEIGVFLEYPLMDVRGFLDNDGKNFVYAGYWKVYHNVRGTVEKFRQYDRERDYTIRAITDGKSIREIVEEAGQR